MIKIERLRMHDYVDSLHVEIDNLNNLLVEYDR
jgi:hypothetical protein